MEIPTWIELARRGIWYDRRSSWLCAGYDFGRRHWLELIMMAIALAGGIFLLYYWMR